MALAPGRVTAFALVDLLRDEKRQWEAKEFVLEKGNKSTSGLPGACL